MAFDPSDYDGFDWDSGNITKNDSKHAVTCREAEEIFFNQPLIVAPDPDHSQAELRFRVLGRTDAGRPESSLAVTPKPFKETGVVSLVVEEVDLAGMQAVIVVLDAEGALIAQTPTILGGSS